MRWIRDLGGRSEAAALFCFTCGEWDILIAYFRLILYIKVTICGVFSKAVSSMIVRDHPMRGSNSMAPVTNKSVTLSFRSRDSIKIWFVPFQAYLGTLHQSNWQPDPNTLSGYGLLQAFMTNFIINSCERLTSICNQIAARGLVSSESRDLQNQLFLVT